MIRILYAVKKSDPDYMEVILTEDETKFRQAKEWARENGYDRFRISNNDLSTPPDFLASIQH